MLRQVLVVFLICVAAVNICIAQQAPSNGPSVIAVDIKVTTASVLPGLAKVELYKGGSLREERLVGGIGKCSFVGLQEGEYTVNVSLPGFMPESRTAVMRGGAQTVSFMLRPEAVATTTMTTGDPIIDQRWLRLSESGRAEILKSREARAAKNYQGAMDHANRALSSDPSAVLAMQELAVAQWKTGQNQKARDTFQSAIKQDSEFLNAYLALADMMMEGKQYSEAGAVLMQAAKAHPTRAEPFKLMAQVQLETGNVDKAQQACDLGIARDHSHVPDIYVVAANIYLRKGDQAKASDALRSYLERAPNGAMADDVRKTLAKLKPAK